MRVRAMHELGIKLFFLTAWAINGAWPEMKKRVNWLENSDGVVG
jgi:hypothetical protein